MEDPVILPSSKSIMDRPSIQTLLLSDPRDPWNRAPLRIEDVVSATELKDKINAWKSQRLQQMQTERADRSATATSTAAAAGTMAGAGDGDGDMDVSEG